MTIESEIHRFLTKTIPYQSNPLRTFEIVKYRYGIGAGRHLTLEEISQLIDDFDTRERVRQILKKHFIDIVKPEDIPTLERVLGLMQNRGYWKCYELIDEMKTSQMIEDEIDFNGFFLLLNELKFQHPYNIYTKNLKPVSKVVKPYPTDIITSSIQSIKHIQKEAQKLSNNNGIANLQDLIELSKRFPIPNDISIKQLLLDTTTFWFLEESENIWFTIEESSRNRIKHFLNEIFSIIESCHIDELTETIHNAFAAPLVKSLA